LKKLPSQNYGFSWSPFVPNVNRTSVGLRVSYETLKSAWQCRAFFNSLRRGQSEQFTAYLST
jgi:hypothetical protein